MSSRCILQRQKSRKDSCSNPPSALISQTRADGAQAYLFIGQEKVKTHPFAYRLQSHSPKSHICDNLNQNVAMQSMHFKLGLFSCHGSAILKKKNPLKLILDSFLWLGKQLSDRRGKEKKSKEKDQVCFTL